MKKAVKSKSIAEGAKTKSRKSSFHYAALGWLFTAVLFLGIIGLYAYNNDLITSGDRAISILQFDHQAASQSPGNERETNSLINRDIIASSTNSDTNNAINMPGTQNANSAQISSDFMQRLDRLIKTQQSVIARLERVERQIDKSAATLSGQSVALKNHEDGTRSVVTGSLPQNMRDASSTTQHNVNNSDTMTSPPISAQQNLVRSGYALDLGFVPNIASAREQWQSFLLQHGSILAQSNQNRALTPQITIEDGRNSAVLLRLIAGPYDDIEQVLRACSQLIANGLRHCAPALFAGQPFLAQSQANLQ